MSRTTFTCARCSSVLALIRPVTVLRVAPGVAVTHNRRFGTLELRCPCGQVERYDVPRKVETMIVGVTEREAA